MEPVKAEGKVLEKKRFSTFIACCPIRVIFDDENECLIGRGSGTLLLRLFLTKGKKSSGFVVEIGNFCESAACTILIGGEHNNAKIFNNSLSSLPLIRTFFKEQGIFKHQATHPQTTRIGHGVILSKNCTINAGADIGMGSVIGSGAVVTRTPIPPWALAAGVPAKPLRPRLTAEQQQIAEELRWWLWDIDFFCRHVHLLFDIEQHYKHLKGEPRFADDRYRLVLRMKEFGINGDISVVGIDNEDRFIPLEQTPKRFQDYFAQMKAPEDKVLTWLANPFRLLE